MSTRAYEIESEEMPDGKFRFTVAWWDGLHRRKIKALTHIERDLTAFAQELHEMLDAEYASNAKAEDAFDDHQSRQP